MRIKKLISLLTVGTVLLGATACSDDETSDPTCTDYSGVSGTASFASDVMPVFQQSCNFNSSCHGSGSTSPPEGLALGPENGTDPTQADIDQVYNDIVGGASVRSTLALVEPGDPGASWLMAKMDYESFTECAALACTSSSSGCGTQMPPTGTPVPEADRAKIRAWIADGAANN